MKNYLKQFLVLILALIMVSSSLSGFTWAEEATEESIAGYTEDGLWGAEDLELLADLPANVSEDEQIAEPIEEMPETGAEEQPTEEVPAPEPEEPVYETEPVDTVIPEAEPTEEQTVEEDVTEEEPFVPEEVISPEEPSAEISEPDQAVPEQEEIPEVPAQEEIPEVPAQEEIPEAPAQEVIPEAAPQEETSAVPAKEEIPAVPEQEVLPEAAPQKETPEALMQEEEPKAELQAVDSTEAESDIPSWIDGEVTDINVNEIVDTEITEAGKKVYFKFVPETTGTYYFRSKDNDQKYMVGYVYYESGSSYNNNWYNGQDYNFSVYCYELTAGETYYLMARFYNSSETGEFKVFITDKTSVEAYTTEEYAKLAEAAK